MSFIYTRLLPILLAHGLFINQAHAATETDFWKWFQLNEASLFDFESDQEKTFDRLSHEMHKIHPSLTFEFGPKQGNQREFIISADGIRDAFPKVESLFSSAPKLPKWKFIKYRPRRDAFDITFDGVAVKASSVYVVLQKDESKVDIIVIIPGYTKAAHQTYAGIAFLFLDQALGEFDVETKVGGVDVRAPSASTAGAISLHELPKAFSAYLVKQ